MLLDRCVDWQIELRLTDEHTSVQDCPKDRRDEYWVRDVGNDGVDRRWEHRAFRRCRYTARSGD